MFKALALFLAAACSGIDASAPDATSPDAAVVLPCDLQHEACAAAHDIASAECEHERTCFEPSLCIESCVADRMRAVCNNASVSCDGPYPDRAQLDACLGDYGARCTAYQTARCSL